MAARLKKVLSPKDMTRLKTFEKEAERIIGKLSEYRDGLRNLIEKYSDILESVSDGVNDASNYLSDFEHAVDRISELI